MASGKTRIILLGRIAVERDGEPESTGGLAGRRAEIVFAYLALEHRRSVTRDELAGALWPDQLPDTWNAALRTVLSDVRRFLERSGIGSGGALVAEQGRLQLHLPPGTTVDVDEARDQLVMARALLTAGEAGPAGHAALAAADAAALPFLSAHDDGWVSEVRSELDRLHIDGLELAAGAFTDAGDSRLALAAADRLVRADPFLEAAHRLRIQLYGAAGDRAGAVKAYDRCKAMLDAEFGIAPSPETDEALRVALGPVGTGEPPTSDIPVDTPRFAALSVLVVEDHDFQRRTTLTLLRGLGARDLRDAADGSAALALLDDGAAPDIIICDIDMPGMDGVEFIRNVAERGLASAVIIASGLDARVLETVRAASEGYGLQVLGAVNKPLTAAALEALLAGFQPAAGPSGGVADPVEAIAALAAALEDGSFHALFEPVVDLAVGRVAAVRAVPGRAGGIDLTAAADAPGVGRQLVEQLLRHARIAARDLHLDAFVSLPASLLIDVGLADRLAAIARERVVLVADVSALVEQSSPAMLDLIARLRVKGFGVCVEGFDAGLVDRLPVTHLALDSGVVSGAALGGDASALVAAVDASRQLGVPMIGHAATSSEFDLLLQLGCSFAYGPFLAPAVSAAQLGPLVASWTAPVSADQTS